jgi:hypothetical protein
VKRNYAAGKPGRIKQHFKRNHGTAKGQFKDWAVGGVIF